MFRQAAQEPLWLLHHTILPLVRGMCLGSPPRELNVSHMCRGHPCSHQNRGTLLLVPPKQCTGYAPCHRVCCKDGVGCRARNLCKCDITPRPTLWKNVHMGKEDTCRKEERASKPTPALVAKGSSGQPVVLK